MKRINTGDKDKLVHVRLNKELDEFVEATAEEYNMKKSEFLRFLITIAKKDFENNGVDKL